MNFLQRLLPKTGPQETPGSKRDALLDAIHRFCADEALAKIGGAEKIGESLALFIRKEEKLPDGMDVEALRRIQGALKSIFSHAKAKEINMAEMPLWQNLKSDIQETSSRLTYNPNAASLKNLLNTIYVPAENSELFTAIENYYGKEQVAAR